MSEMRDLVRAAIMNSSKGQPVREEIDFLGTRIELRSPTLGSILASQRFSDADADADVDVDLGTGSATVVGAVSNRQVEIVRSLIEYAYVPGTDERVFESGDLNALLQLAYTTDLQNAFTTLTRLLNPNFESQLESSG